MVANRLIKRNIGNEIVRSGYDLGEKILRNCERCGVIRVYELKCLRCIYRMDEGNI